MVREFYEQQEKAAEVMNKLVESIAEDGGMDPNIGSMARETPILIAAKNGNIKMIEKILEIFPEAVYDVDSNMKNIVLLSVEHKQFLVYNLLLQKKEKNIIHDSMFWEVDNEGNTALHLAAKVGSPNFWPVPGAALQMNWEIKWFENVKARMPERFRFIRNNAGETPEEVFTKSHENLVREGGKWLTDITSIASPVATGLFVAIAFSSLPNVDVKKLHKNSFKSNFEVDLLTTLLSYGLSMTAVLFFILVITFSRSERSFRTFRSTLGLLLLGLTACYFSALATLTTFVGGRLYFDIVDPERREFDRKYTVIIYVGIVFLTIVTMIPYLGMLVAFMGDFRKIAFFQILFGLNNID